MSDSVRPHRWQPTRLCHPWDSPGKNAGVGCHFLLQRMKVKVKSLSHVMDSVMSSRSVHPMDCSLPGSSIHGIFQARVLEWVAIALWLTYITFPLPRWGPPRHRGVKDLFKVAQLAVVGKSVHSNFHSLYYLHQGRFHRGFGVCSWKLWDSQVTLVVNNPPANAGDQCWRCKRRAFNPWVKIPWRRTRNPL